MCFVFESSLNDKHDEHDKHRFTRSNQLGIRIEIAEQGLLHSVAYPQLYCDLCDSPITTKAFNAEVEEDKPQRVYFIHKACSVPFERKLKGTNSKTSWTSWQEGYDFFSNLMQNIVIDEQLAKEGGENRPTHNP